LDVHDRQGRYLDSLGRRRLLPLRKTTLKKEELKKKTA